MMKKKYLIPNTSVVEVKTEGALLTESWHTGEESLPIIGPDDEDDKITDEDNDQWTPNRSSNSKSFNVWE
ncbi:hypothetical protein [Leyella lascolaii]|uniref:Uncharacterized protein n=1 Tax=Leyella lascolaii TaxID=1776379 RepID=A0AAW7JXW0_9BACT|nr:hypothetical protein [Leyella lascolaii]MDN0023529.1 hypothetical protein [Leyella lascolaii]MDN0026187.1 hypothetical protein [Leyella lascolaii]